MISLLKRRKTSRSLQRDDETLRMSLWDRFIQNPHHTWIADHPRLCAIFWDFYQLFPRTLLNLLEDTHHLVFIRANGRLSCALSTVPNAHITLVFPELEKMLLSAAPEYGLAVLAHELGHIVCGHSHKSLNPLLAQVQADQWAITLGLGMQLMEVLQEFSDNPECLERIHFIRQKLTK